MFITLDSFANMCGRVEILSTMVQSSDYDAFVTEIAPIFEKYAQREVYKLPTTKRTVCKTNIRKALSKSYWMSEYEYIPVDRYCYVDVNDRWKAAWVGYHEVELYDWRNDVSLTVRIHPHRTFTEELEEATQLLMDAYEEHCNND